MGTEASYRLVLAHWELQATGCAPAAGTRAAHLGQWHLAESGTVCTASHRIPKTSCEAGGTTVASQMRTERGCPRPHL